MKKDYLEEGAMADTADLVVLGAYYGTGSKGQQHILTTHAFVNHKLFFFRTLLFIKRL